MLTIVIAGLVGLYCWIIPQTDCAAAPASHAQITADPDHHWQAYAWQADAAVPLGDVSDAALPPETELTMPDADLLPAAWEVIDTQYADLTGDGQPEYALIVWRPWLDWPVMRWHAAASPIAAHQDAAGHSCHIILLNPTSRDADHTPGRAYELIWAGSALARPVTAIAVTELDGQPGVELIVLESRYQAGREAPADCFSVWQWNGFGFIMLWRSEPGCYQSIRAIDTNGDGTAEILVRNCTLDESRLTQDEGGSVCEDG